MYVTLPGSFEVVTVSGKFYYFGDIFLKEEEYACSVQFYFLTNCQSSMSVRKEFSNKRLRQTPGTIDTY